MAQLAARIDKGLELVDNLAVFIDSCTDFRDDFRFVGQARGLQIEGHKLPIQSRVAGSMDHHPVVHVVDIIALDAVEDFNVLVGTGHLGFARRFHGFGEGLETAVVRNGDGLMAPFGRLFDGGGGGGQAVHGGHGRM